MLAMSRIMDTLFIAGRDSLSDAQDLIRDFGGAAGLQAAVRAEQSNSVTGARLSG